MIETIICIVLGAIISILGGIIGQKNNKIKRLEESNDILTKQKDIYVAHNEKNEEVSKKIKEIENASATLDFESMVDGFNAGDKLSEQ